ncbi:biotin-dependent carboxyltransferase family protein [Faecalispora jeddahensis]|uniref:5-oxoprolinase subunit C family protein n=1 Tax=Faecalispora jeddahensis TaxID=1414721 RepID=UPI0027BA8113|nr:biotin-dependent carboxyltransferase family protein [Faecalispora jeddahensis]
MNAVKVISPGALTTVQDAGRFGFLQSGISVSGVMDSYSHRAANLLVDNPQEEAVLEVTLMGPVLEFQCSTRIAVTGAVMQLKLNDQPVPMWQTIPVKEGDRLSFAGIQGGCRAYIAFAGGLDVPVIMGSKSTNLKAQMGGFEGRMLKRDDIVPLKAPSGEAKLWAASEEWISKFPTQITLRAVLGPQEDLFTEEGIASFLNTEYVVTPANDRMGYRLEGEEIIHKAGADIVSDGIVMGAVQVPSSGQPIILMADRQTTGGYTKIATVVTADLPLLAQAQAGTKIRFQQVSVEDAQQLLHGFHERLQAFARTRRPVNG